MHAFQFHCTDNGSQIFITKYSKIHEDADAALLHGAQNTKMAQTGFVWLSDLEDLDLIKVK